MTEQTFDNVFDALTGTPAEAANMKARASLMSAIIARVGSWGLSQAAGSSPCSTCCSRRRSARASQALRANRFQPS